MQTVSPTSIASNDYAFESLERLNKNAEALRKGDTRAREAMIADCFSLMADLETPNETFVRLVWPYLTQPVALRLASDMKIFESLSAAAKPLHTKEVAAPVSADLRLTRKVLKMLASFHVIKEVDVDMWATNAFADSMASDVWKQALSLCVPYASETMLKMPEFFREKQYQFPTGALDAPAQYAHGVSGKMHFFELMRRDGLMPALESLMRVLFDKRPHWSAEKSGFYPVRERLLEGASKDSDAAFLVDVGGGQGQDFPRLLANVPGDEIAGRLVLQDTPDVIASVPEDSLPRRVEVMGYDFFTPQPVTGARVYLMHSIIHNHPDDRAKLILKQVAGAMKRGYSKLLLWDNVMPDKGAVTNTMCLDFQMMAFYAAGQRTEQEWKALIEDPEVGLMVTDIIRYSPQDQAVIEVELA